MKRNYLYLALSLLLVGCNNENISSSNDSTNTSSTDTTSSNNPTDTSNLPSESTTKNYKLSGITTTNGKEFLPNVKITCNDKVTFSNSEGKYSLDGLNADDIVSFIYTGYETKSVAVATLIKDSNKDLTMTVDMVKSYSLIGFAKENKTWTNFGNFAFYATRSSNEILAKFVTDNTSWLHNDITNQIELYISTGMATATRNSNAYQILYSSNEECVLKQYKTQLDAYEKENSITTSNRIIDNQLEITIAIPYLDVNISSQDVFGIAFGEWTNNVTVGSLQGDFCLMSSAISSKDVIVENPESYDRIDENCNLFANKYNCLIKNNPVINYDKEILVTGYPIEFAKTGVASVDADDIFAKYTTEDDGFVFDMIGFGDFQDEEAIKIVIHAGQGFGSNWEIKSTDLSIFVNKEKATYKTNSTNFFDFASINDSTDNLAVPTYTNYDGYFTLSLKVPFTTIPNYSKDTNVRVSFFEFGKEIYNDDCRNAMFVDNVSCGDLAHQENYLKIQSVEGDIDVFEGYNIRFATTQDDIYAKISRDYTNQKLVLDMKAFGELKDDTFIRFVVKTDDVLNEAWGLSKTDVSFVIYKNVAYSSIGQTNFWDNEANQFHLPNSETIYNPIYNYNEDEGCYTLRFEIDFSELACEVNTLTKLKGILIEFINNGVIVGNNCYFVNGQQGKDPAYQENYFEF